MHCWDLDKVVENVKFEKADAKIQRSQLHNEAINLLSAERYYVEHFSKSVSSPPTNDSETEGAPHEPSHICPVFKRFMR